MTLRRATILTASCTGGRATSLRTPSKRVRMRNDLFIGLEVNIRCALLDGVEQDLIDEAHDRGVLNVVAPERVRIGVFVAARDFEILEIEVVIGQARHGRFGLIHGFADGHLQLVVLDHDELDAHRGLEANLIQGVQIGRIGNGQEQALAALHQRQYAVLLQQLVAHRANRVHIERHRIQVQQRHAKLVRGGDGDIAGRGQVGGDQMRDQTEALFLRLAMASCMACSSNSPSWTRRCARPPKATRLVPPTAAIALSFMDLP